MEAFLEEFGSELLERPEVQVLAELLQKPDASPTAAVQRLLQSREIPPQKGDESPSSNNTNGAGNHAWFTMFPLVELASLTPAAQQAKLIEFVAQLQKTPVIDPVTAQPPTVADDLKLWTDLPYLRIYLADRSGFRAWTPSLSLFPFSFPPLFGSFAPTSADWDQAGYVKKAYPEAEEYPPAEVREWENRNAFMAQLTAAADELSHPMDFSLYGLYACRSAFEEKEEPVEEAVRAACIWFIYAGARMWENCQARRGFGDSPDDPRYFDLPRWRRWEEGLQAARREFRRQSTQELIQTALMELGRAQSRIH
ncbi:hypothetical protein ASPACDRAFT_1856000 [Aspergillus aculeatus ATCC 16872]|uniref:Uncharacterized protein n=1 Tax=Aspergillus aculeatus (strain ATCC 16872 / CBS 172.66 / WB 5094) TaxID=690307 RepID=A0A1L9WVY1_ASPA1|nr:uncharacterized protein ASPACDRAFT_1856000 [Aspergillus aculeatus ATCC 16872]OJK00427.1 hypothetical protein ASPACDRAFT_1856000 [Aspergillus aculeatus ATCC 16872]